MVQLSTTMPSMDPANYAWACTGDPVTNQIIFKIMILEGKEAAEASNYISCNSNMEPGAFTLYPKMFPVRPLLSTNRSTKQAGHFWKSDSTCLKWLDQQSTCSVIYVAFGSLTVFDQHQFKELAVGLELTNKPFLDSVIVFTCRHNSLLQISYIYVK
ncbi:putative hydroquinone glucosyltransferase [Helianthus annuus]|uniref:Hydroquinone glucosyltransferase n=2 Tax=Helianthus annuus TaxID=4232 RepID=A0A9K3I8U9_HELAN|nr:putative hydroquinone glucosyltransferase [Helianthus annuus]KAJ0526967.1 putative hydroquinone glucosyltransferase [Helianthus annuus]KAJ0535542.1 putative hydroquinone glucosyltransferase [Helianthus annuus]KAJ0543361.1 putative hydroquinone glucosyltransferase [Helianthus annuus]KAJ0712346.1 putative hydroquinone glucosyltransferase [Helianthus annuus]